MPSVAFWPGVPGGTAQYRCYTPGDALARRGWDVNYILTSDDGIDADVVVFSRVISVVIPDVIREVRARTGALIVFDIDDYYDGIPGYNPAAYALDDPTATLAHLHEAMSLADLITVTTPGLAALYGHLAPTAVLPNLLAPDVWTDNERYRVAHDGIHVGWLAAYEWRGGDIEILRPWLPGFLKAHPEVTFCALGCPQLLADLGIDGIPSPPYVDAPEGWKDENIHPYEHLPALLGIVDVGLVPLTYNRFNWAGKSACKSMEYNAMGIPSVASPSQANTAYIRPGVNGYLVRKGEWVRTLERAIDNLDTLRAGALAVAAEHYIDRHIDKWVMAYEHAAGHRHHPRAALAGAPSR